MAHEIATTNGRHALAYFGDVPWHGLGTKLDEPATAEQAMESAGLNYTVQLQSLWTSEGDSVSSRKAVVRNDTNQVLGVVSNSYQPVQNHQCFSFLDAVVADGRLRYHTAGALGHGERVWMLAKIPGEIRVKDCDDVTDKFLLLSNSHDGSSSLRVYFTPIRVVCANTLGMAERRSRGEGVSIAHRGNLAAKVAEAQEILGFATRYYDDLAGKIDQLASHYPTRKQLTEYFESLYPDRDDRKNRRAQNVRAELTRLFTEGRGQDIPQTRFTAWSALNAVTEFVDHYRSTRGKTGVERSGSRLQSAWFGAGARLKSKAWNEAMAMAN
jgi:phage/plasmid-like protein (TIGR03299 family)